jgi:hypothetical protein
MASIAGSTKYGEGHKIVLKTADKISSAIGNKFTAAKYKLGESVFSITKSAKAKDITTVIELAAGSLTLYVKDDKNKVVLIKGSESSINTAFNHFSENAKSDTGKLTEIKELVSMYLFESVFENNKMLSEDIIRDKLGAKKTYYDSLYYESAVKQVNELKKFLKAGKGYTYERQAQNLTKDLYTVGRKLSGKANDNWNPADVWMIKKTFNISKLIAAKSIDELNTGIAAAYKRKDLIPISLKQVESNQSAAVEVVDPANAMSQKLEYDMSFSKVDLSDTFANFIVQTKSGFAVRCGFKASATTLNVSLEGRFLGAGYQLGAVDAKQYGPHVQKNYQYNVRSGVGVTAQDYTKAKTELKQMFTKFPRLSNTLKDYKQAEAIFNKADKLTKDRFANLISYLYSFMMAAGTPAKFKENMTFCYYSSKKISTDSCLYIVVKGV